MAISELQQVLYERGARSSRIPLIAKALAEGGDRAMKITIQYQMNLLDGKQQQQLHLGGLHITPHPHVIYTTAGTFGDHDNGPRHWVPCLDSASTKHRCSKTLTIQVTAKLKEGFRAVGCGEDFGVHQVYIHEGMAKYDGTTITQAAAAAADVVSGSDDNNDITSSNNNNSMMSRVLGNRHVEFCQESSLLATTNPHCIIPPDHHHQQQPSNSNTTTNTSTTMASMYATSCWCSQIWVPAPSRSLGFAIGPFQILEDAEYFSLDDDDDDIDDDPDEDDDDDDEGVENAEVDDDDDMMKDDDNDQKSKKKKEKEGEEENENEIDIARRRGEGIRQVFLAPSWERKHLLYPNANMSLLLLANTNTNAAAAAGSIEIQYQPRTVRQQHQLREYQETLSSATVGVPHRALSLTRDLLALPSYRTASYTQVWIPNAVHGGVTSGAPHDCPEAAGCNPFLGGAVLDARLLPPLNGRLPYYHGGRVLQCVQARNAIRGWVVAALPLGNDDDVGYGYVHSLVESALLAFYERGHGGYGEGGSAVTTGGGGNNNNSSVFFCPRRAVRSGLQSPNLDFLPIRNVESLPSSDGGSSSIDLELMAASATAAEDGYSRHSLWRTAANGTESFTSGLDEYGVRQVWTADILEALERGVETSSKTPVPLPSFGWSGSHLALSFLSSTAASSSDLGCGAVELAHPVGGLLYRVVKSDVLRRLMEGRAGTSNLIRVIRAGFLAGYLGDLGETKLNWEQFVENKKDDKKDTASTSTTTTTTTDTKQEKETTKTTTTKTTDKKKKATAAIIRPPFVICVDKLLSTGGFTHTLFTSGLRLLAGPMKEAHLRGTLVDVERNVRSTTTNRQFVDPEGFPNSYVRGASMPYLRIGAHVDGSSSSESSYDNNKASSALSSSAGAAAASSGANKGPQLQVVVEPATPAGGISYGGPMTLRIIENEGQVREVMKLLNIGTRSDWGPLFLHTKPVTTAKEQLNASGGVIEAAAAAEKKSSSSSDNNAAGGDNNKAGTSSNNSSGTTNTTTNNNDASSDNINTIITGGGDEPENTNKSTKNNVLNIFEAHTLANSPISSTTDESTTTNNNYYDENMLHIDGFQAIELLRLTNLTPLLWIRVDPYYQYGARQCIVQPDYCYAEQLFHDGDVTAQVEAIRALSERPLSMSSSSSSTTLGSNTNSMIVHNVSVFELPVRLLGDCLRGSPALHGDLPHTPAARVQAALGIAQWQNNKAPSSSSSKQQQQHGPNNNNWLGLNLLLQYFKERYYLKRIGSRSASLSSSNNNNNTNNASSSCCCVVTPVKFQRLAVKKAKLTSTAMSGDAEKKNRRELDDYVYVDDDDETNNHNNNNDMSGNDTDDDNNDITTTTNNKKKNATEKKKKKKTKKSFDNNNDHNDHDSEEIVAAEWEEDEEYRVRSAVVTAIASVRAKDGKTPSVVVEFLETVLDAGDDVSLVDTTTTRNNTVTTATTHNNKRNNNKSNTNTNTNNVVLADVSKLKFVSSRVIADVLLACCYIHVQPSTTIDIETGNRVQKKDDVHPALGLLVASRRWLEWELYRESIREETRGSTYTIMGGNCYDGVIACGIAAVSTLGILIQTTTDKNDDNDDNDDNTKRTTNNSNDETNNDWRVVTSVPFYKTILERDARSDVTKAACAQAIACICCAADRFETTTDAVVSSSGNNNTPNTTTSTNNNTKPSPPLGLLTALEYLLQQILHPESSPGYRQTLALLMMDTCTGKVSSMQRVAVIGGHSDLIATGARFYHGPLGASNGTDNGSALFLNCAASQHHPVANAVNDGARRGLRWLSRAGHARDEMSTDEMVVRAARFATDLWRTMNGHDIRSTSTTADGVCANDSVLRCSFLALWQWIWPKACFAVLKVQSWRCQHEDTPRYKRLGAPKVLQVYPEETAASETEERSYEPLLQLVSNELDRQLWRGEMVTRAYEHYKQQSSSLTNSNTATSTSSNSDGTDPQQQQHMPPIVRDAAFKHGGWVTSTSRQRRQLQLDGGVAVTKIRMSVKGPE